jgi:glycerophosphoryl diester phosphodiesterase
MLVIAHRGASGEFTEGTESAYLAAIKQGADSLECDLRLTKDNQIICFHDRNTKRLHNLDLEIAKSRYKELTQGLDIFRFEELLKLAINNKKSLLIEFKHPVPTGGKVERLTHRLLKAYQGEIKKSGINVELISFSYLATLRNIFLSKGLFQSGILINTKIYAKLIPTKLAVFDIKFLRANPSIGYRCKKQGMRFYIYTINTADDLKFAKEIGADGVITDYPQRARKLLGYP